MQLCHVQRCTCFHHRLLDCITQKINGEAQLLLTKIQNLRDVADASGKTLLHYSAEYGNVPMVEYLLAQGCKINAQDDFGTSPLMLAINVANVAVVEILLKNNANIYDTDSNGISAMQLAFQCRLKTTIVLSNPNRQLILDMLFTNLNNDYLTNKQAITKLFLNAGRMERLAAVSLANVELAAIVLESGFPINFCEPVGNWTALHCAIVLARFENAKLLIERGANVNAVNKCGDTPLYYYDCNFECLDRNSEVLKMLLKFCNDVNVPDERYCGTSHVDRLLLFGMKETVMTLLQSDIDAIKNHNSNSPLLCKLMSNKNIDFIDLIESANKFGITFEIDARNSNNNTVLMLAVMGGFKNLRIVEFLIKCGADVNYAKPDEVSILHVAAANCFSKVDEKVIELLLRYGANAQLIFSDGNTLIDDLFAIESDREVSSIKPIVAHLALLETIKKSSVSEIIRKSIDEHVSSKNHFDFCLRQLGMLKSTVVYGTITIFTLLHESDKKLVAYARNRELILAFKKKTIKSMPHLKSYYFNTLYKRVADVENQMEFELKWLQLLKQ